MLSGGFGLAMAGLRFLVRLTSDLGLSESSEYAAKLKKAEKAKEIKEQRTSSSGSRSGSHRGSGRLSRDGSASSNASYEDPLGPLEERPRTAARTRNQVEDDFDNEELGDDMLPE
ncbi:hypothetical protein HPB50_001129 [Hyalomma asiaticum]|uniref:Uncharacterized protein n=1 Tax=Hyalomma asiaticum TaxID=266040 RepID=A0ACB7RXA1_HYAAI|nr:hypothetical protein HPB50_001129 [Hyalomma asiaticum]